MCLVSPVDQEGGQKGTARAVSCWYLKHEMKKTKYRKEVMTLHPETLKPLFPCWDVDVGSPDQELDDLIRSFKTEWVRIKVLKNQHDFSTFRYPS